LTMADEGQVDVEAVGVEAIGADNTEVGVEAVGADNTEVSHVSGCSRLGNSLVMAFCVGPAVILGMCFLLGWNERRAVCDMKAITQGKAEVVESECDTASGNGGLVMFSCDLQRNGLPTFIAAGDFSSSVNFQGTGLKTEAQILQCVESQSTTTKKDSVGGGTTKVTTYTYERQWVSSHVDSSGFHKKASDNFRVNCGAENPAWPAGAPTSQTAYALSGTVGPFTVPKSSFLERVPLNYAINGSSIPDGWQQNGLQYTKSMNYTNNLGDVRVNFYGNNWDEPRLTVLGLSTGSKLGRWTAKDSWLCSGFQLAELHTGTMSKDELFSHMEAKSSTITWLLRFVALLFLWMGFCAIFKPLEVVADCIPWIGPYLGNSVSFVVGCVTCPLAFGCGLGVAGIVWVVMRPLIGGMMLVLFCLCFGGAVALKLLAKKKDEGGGGNSEAQNES